MIVDYSTVQIISVRIINYWEIYYIKFFIIISIFVTIKMKIQHFQGKVPAKQFIVQNVGKI